MISGRRSNVTRVGAHAFLAALAGLALRLLFVWRYPAPAGDSALYLDLARNWADAHIYGLWIDGHLTPADIRVPGYPAFLAAIGALFGRSPQAILLSQAALDVLTCWTTAALAAALAPRSARQRVAIAGLWIAATCPFVANYTSAVLTETLVTFLATSALMFFVLCLEFDHQSRPFAGSPATPLCWGALLTGVASLVRPEMPLLFVTAGAVFVLRWWPKLGARRIAQIGAAAVAVFLLPLAPWIARNFFTLHEMQFSAPRYATLPGESAPLGYFAWTKTWLVRYQDVYQTVWKVGTEPLEMETLPASAFDSSEEKARVRALLQRYNDSPTLDFSAELDATFADIARDRTRRRPWRTYLQVPFERALSIWFTPRVELLPVSSTLRPFLRHRSDISWDFVTTAVFGLLNYVYVALALAGICIAWRATKREAKPQEEAANFWGVALILAYLAIRTGFLTNVEAPEPRYVVSCYPAVLALAALAIMGTRNRGDFGSRQRSSTGSG